MHTSIEKFYLKLLITHRVIFTWQTVVLYQLEAIFYKNFCFEEIHFDSAEETLLADRASGEGLGGKKFEVAQDLRKYVFKKSFQTSFLYLFLVL